MLEEEQRVFIAIENSTAHGTYNNGSFGLAPSAYVQLCTSGWDYEFDRKECEENLFNRPVLKSLLLQNWIEWPMAYNIFKLFFLNTHSYKDAFDQQGIISTKKYI